MKMTKGTGLLAGILFLTTPMWAGTYYGGFEDSTGSGSDYDYNDIVFSISGSDLTLVSSGSWFNYSQGLLLSSADGANGLGAGLGTGISPFWDRTSQDADHPDDNVGYCIYGDASDPSACGGNPAAGPPTHGIAGASGIDGSGQYLASAGGLNNPEDVYFTATSPTASIIISITADSDSLYYVPITGGLAVTPTALNAVAITSGHAFTPGGEFELVGFNASTGSYYSSDGSAQFAFFNTGATVIPEPASMALLGSGLLAFGLWSRKRSRR